MDTFGSDWMGSSHFIMQTSNFLFMNATALTLSQGQRKVIQYIPRFILSFDQISKV